MFPAFREEAIKAELGKILSNHLGPNFERRLSSAEDIASMVNERLPGESMVSYKPNTAGVANTSGASDLLRASMNADPQLKNQWEQQRAGNVQATREAQADVLGAPHRQPGTDTEFSGAGTEVRGAIHDQRIADIFLACPNIPKVAPLMGFSPGK